MPFDPLPPDIAPLWDLIALVISFVSVMAVVQINGVLQKRAVLPTGVTRKLVHLLVGPVFLVTWLLYSGEWYSRFFAALVPLMFVLLFYGIGKGKVKNDIFVKSMSRSGDPSELLKGPLYYTIIILLVTLVWFYAPFDGGDATPVALIVIGCLAGGDGMADMVGRRFGRHKYGFFGTDKSIEGSVGMLIGSILFCTALVVIFGLSVVEWRLSAFIFPIMVISIVTTVFEGTSLKNTDNWSITIAAIIVMFLANAFDPSFWPFQLWG